MTWLGEFYRTTVGKKAVMALTGIILFGYVLAHMAGNLKLYQGREGLNEYANWLREMGTPAFPHSGPLWSVRVVLLAALVLHVVASVQLTRSNWQARPEGYARRQWVQTNFASRTMRWTGWLLAAFVVFHLLHLTFGTAHHDFNSHDVYHNVVSGFQRWWVSGIYIVAQLALGLHLYHGLWSLFQSLGWNHPRFNHWRRPLATLLMVVIVLGNLSLPLAVLTGLVK
jgi:succinate dehydrogenase / fumarate reductase cytochrome b subunit